MNEKNINYLENSLKFHGFGEGLNGQLKKAVESGKEDFQLSYQNAFGRDKVDYTLNFKKGKEDVYFFNSFDAALKVSNGEGRSFRVYLENKGKDITAKEAFNLLSDRAVFRSEVYNKGGEKYSAWVELDFNNKQENGQPKMVVYHENYGYDISKVLAKFPFTGQDTPDQMDMFLKSLHRGNLQVATWDIDGTESKVFVSANPKFKSINLYDEKAKRLYIPDEVQKERKADVSAKLEAAPFSEKRNSEGTAQQDKRYAAKKQKRMKMKI